MLKAVAALAAALCCESALAATGSAPGQNPAASGLFLGLAIAYLSRRRKIGGWLLYYYLQLFLSVVLMCVVSLPMVAKQIQPAEWDNASLYVWYTLSTVPVLVVLIAEVVLAAVLLFRRNEAMLRRLRLAQLALVVASGASLCIDIAYFDETATIFLDCYSLFFAVIWAWYFRRATRVQQVFVEHSWDYDGQQAAKHVPTKAELRYLWIRAAISAGIVFVLLLVMMGSALEGKRPDVGIFYVPLFYAAISAALGRYLPIRQKKRESLNAAGSGSVQA